MRTKRVQAVAFGGEQFGGRKRSRSGRHALIAHSSGETVSGAGTVGLFADSRSGADLFKHLVDLQNQLLNGDAATIQSTTYNDLKKDEENRSLSRASNGALQSRLETSSKHEQGSKARA
jgi:hypothetical protein